MVPAEPEVPDSGSYEVRFPDGRPSVFFYFDDNPRRASLSLAMTSEEAGRQAQELARLDKKS